MSSIQTEKPQQICEQILFNGKQDKIAKNILFSENKVADRLLARGVELKDAYEELHMKLHRHPHALQAFLDVLLSTAAFWNEERIQLARTARTTLINFNQQIARKAAELSVLLQQRSDLHNRSDFSSNTHYHVCDIMKDAAQGNYLFQSYVRDELAKLTYRFDLKYWPTPSAFLQEIADDAERAVVYATDPLTAAATASSRPSLSDYLKALFAAIEENGASYYGPLPQDFSVTDRTLATLTNCALGLEPDDLINDVYMKRFRQRLRSGKN